MKNEATNEKKPNKFLEGCKKVSKVTKLIFGYGIMISLFAGGLTFVGYLVAMIIGGDVAAEMCRIIYKEIIPIIIYVATSMILLGLISMYLAGEFALTPDKKKKKRKHNISKDDGEM